MTTNTFRSAAPWEYAWPSHGLEAARACPVCAGERRSVLHAELVDNSFLVASGKWTLWRCNDCRCAYLDPRPSPDTIGDAYAAYYTHAQAGGKPAYASLSSLRKLRRRLVNGYVNWRYGADEEPASRLGVACAAALPAMRTVVDRTHRHLPRLPDGGGRLLDVGCGDGAFLALARDIGWEVLGLDPDPAAAGNAARQGITVYQGDIRRLDDWASCFDVITLNHVIEHVHDPIAVLRACHRLLKPGGRLWLETPNVDSLGHARFGRNWRGLETPRHLVLFGRRGLRQACMAAGFAMPRDLPRPSPCLDIYRASQAMANGLPPQRAEAASGALKRAARRAALLGRVRPARREFLTMEARKS